MKTDHLAYWILYFIVSILIAWVALSLVLIWANPALYNPDGTLNWWVTLWVTAVAIVFAWLIVIILHFLIRFLFPGGRMRVYCPEKCPKEPECPPKLDECGRPIKQESMMMW